MTDAPIRAASVSKRTVASALVGGAISTATVMERSIRTRSPGAPGTGGPIRAASGSERTVDCRLPIANCQLNRAGSVSDRSIRTRSASDGPITKSPNRLRAYVLLETVVATGMLIVGLAAIGAQIQESNKAVHTMRLKTRASMLAEMQLAELDLGLIKLDSVDPVQEGDFGSRYPDWGWRLVTEPTAIDEMYRLTIEVLYKIRGEEYRKDSFDYKGADTLFTAAAFRMVPKPLDLTADFGMNETELADFSDKVVQGSIPCFEGGVIDPACLLQQPIEDLMKVLVALQKAGVNLGDFESMIPPDLLKSLQQIGMLDSADSAASDGQDKKP